MEEIPVAAAAERLGITEWAARKMISAGRLAATGVPARVSLADVDRVRRERRADALHRIGGDEVGHARQVAATLRPPPPETVTLTDGRTAPAYTPAVQASGVVQPTGRRALEVLRRSSMALQLWGVDVIDAAWRTSGCRWCMAVESAEVHERPVPQDTRALRVLLGLPCGRDTQRWQAEQTARRREMARLAAEEAADRKQAERRRAQAAFNTAHAAELSAHQRTVSAAKALSAMDPAIARQAAAEARRQADTQAFTAADRQRRATVARNRARLDWRP